MSTPAQFDRRRLLVAAAASAACLAGGRRVLADEAPEVPGTRVQRMPAAFVGHGSPLLALDRRKGAALTAWGASHARPVAVLSVSAHFQRAPITVGATRRLPLMYDFRGFPEALRRVRYEAPGAPKLARRVRAVLEGAFEVADAPRRGHDHGTWVPLRWMLPRADVPVLSVSLPSHDARTLVRIGRALRPLREEGVWILGSGSLTHNLRRLGRSDASPTPAWAKEFDHWAQETCTAFDLDALLDWQRKAPAARTNHPTVEHFVPLLLAAGARRDGEVARFPVSGFEYGSISRRCVEWHSAPAPEAPRDG